MVGDEKVTRGGLGVAGAHLGLGAAEVRGRARGLRVREAWMCQERRNDRDKQA